MPGSNLATSMLSERSASTRVNTIVGSYPAALWLHSTGCPSSITVTLSIYVKNRLSHWFRPTGGRLLRKIDMILKLSPMSAMLRNTLPSSAIFLDSRFSGANMRYCDSPSDSVDSTAIPSSGSKRKVLPSLSAILRNSTDTLAGSMEVLTGPTPSTSTL